MHPISDSFKGVWVYPASHNSQFRHVARLQLQSIHPASTLLLQVTPTQAIALFPPLGYALWSHLILLLSDVHAWCSSSKGCLV